MLLVEIYTIKIIIEKMFVNDVNMNKFVCH